MTERVDGADAQPVLVDLGDSRVAVVTLNRPDRMYSWGGGVASAFSRCIDRDEAGPGVRGMVLTGSGRAFYAADVARSCAPGSFAVIKRQIDQDAWRNLHDSSAEAEKLMHEPMQRPDFIEGITAFFEKRQPSSHRSRRKRHDSPSVGCAADHT